MKSKGSIQRWLTVAALLSVGVSVALSGAFVERTVRERLVAEAESALESVLRLGAMRAVGEARLARRDDVEFTDNAMGFGTTGFLWLVEEEKLGGSPEDAASFERVAQMAAFPMESFLEQEPVLPEQGVEFSVVEGADGKPHRVASFISIPALDRPKGPNRGGAGRLAGRMDGRLEGRRDEGGGPPSRRLGPQKGMQRGMQRGTQRGERNRPMMGPGPGFRPDEAFRVSVATSMVEERAFLDVLLRTLLLAGALAMGLSALLIPWAVRRGLRPVRTISDEIGRMDEDRLDRSLEIEAPPAELAPIVQSFEDARERLSEAFVREKRFTSDAAHELRTPLAGLRASMEVALRRERSPDQYRDTMTECLGITESMQGMVESLLLLAKGEADQIERSSVDLGVVLDEALAKRTEDLSARGLTVQVAPGARPSISSSQVLVERIFANITRNAAQYATEGSTIQCSFEESPEHVRWTMGNEAAHLPADTEERAFDPLWRGDAARSDASLHAGLGLTLVAQCVEALDGTVSLNAADGRFEITVELPR